MSNNHTTIEDLLELSAGLQGQAKIQLDSSEVTIIYSIARQTFKGVALTDRQYALMQEKLAKYREQFTALEYNFDTAINTLRKPLRDIDRRKHIKLVDQPDHDLQTYTKDLGSKIPWFYVRFPFSKSLIVSIENCKSDTRTYYHPKGSHTHYFLATEKNVFNVINEFKNKEFEIDNALMDYYNRILETDHHPELYLSGVFENKLCNIHPKAQEIINQEMPELSEETLVLYYDRRYRYGLEYFSKKPQNKNLAYEIAVRKDAVYHSKPSVEHLTTLVESLYSLDRFPLLVVVDENFPEEQLHDVLGKFKYIVPSEQQSVLFRLPNDGAGASFNEYIRENKLNNWVDKNTKIVYINNNKLPKLTINGEWKPIAALCFNSQLNRVVDTYIKNYCDLIIFREEQMNLMRKYSRFYV